MKLNKKQIYSGDPTVYADYALIIENSPYMDIIILKHLKFCRHFGINHLTPSPCHRYVDYIDPIKF